MKMKSIEKLIKALRRHSFTLELQSTIVGCSVLYTACFWRIDDKICPKCTSYVPNTCYSDVYISADTVKEAIVLAARACIKEARLDIDIRDYE